MSTAPIAPIVEYPDSDGEPMSDNTLQFQWIVTLQGGLDDLFRDRPDVFVAGDLLWYPVQGDNTIRTAPDALVAFGRPKGYRGSYRQWEEGGIAPQVVLEVLSPGNRPGQMAEKFAFYERYGVEEYYLYDPERLVLRGWRRGPRGLDEIPQMHGYTSPRLDITFDLSGGELRILRPDGRPFATYLELAERAEEERQEKEAAQQRAEQERQEKEAAQQWAEQERQRAEEERQEKEAAQQWAEQERQRAEQTARMAEQERQAKEAAQQRADLERQDKETARQRAERLAAQLRTMGIEPEA